MHFPEEARDCVVFLGHANHEGNPESFVPSATGFFVVQGIAPNSQLTYLVTAKHCVKRLFSDPFHIRFNRSEDACVELVENPVWHFHEDDNVDVAVMRLMWPAGASCRAVPERMMLSSDRLAEGDIGAGDLTYTVGLFRHLGGKSRNIPLVHTGYVAAVPETERVRVSDWDAPTSQQKYRDIEAYIVQCSTLSGASGSPVFLRKTVEAADAQHSHEVDRVHRDRSTLRQGPRVPPSGYGALFLLGLWHGSWETDEVQFSGPLTVRSPAGYGIVIPAQKIFDSLPAQ